MAKHKEINQPYGFINAVQGMLDTKTSMECSEINYIIIWGISRVYFYILLFFFYLVSSHNELLLLFSSKQGKPSSRPGGEV